MFLAIEDLFKWCEIYSHKEYTILCKNWEIMFLSNPLPSLIMIFSQTYINGQVSLHALR